MATSQSDRITRQIQDRYGSEPEHLWAKYPDYAVFRHPASKKWYALFMTVPKNRLGLDSNEPIPVLDIKCSPLMTGSLLSETGFLPAYHMNKNTWISVLLDNSIPDDKICALLELAYNSVVPKRRKATGGAF